MKGIKIVRLCVSIELTTVEAVAVGLTQRRLQAPPTPSTRVVGVLVNPNSSKSRGASLRGSWLVEKN